jgi:YD repeat-containing protein
MEIRRNRNATFLWMSALIASAIFASTLAYAANGSVAYSYDALGRITAANYDTGVCVVYSYDANGNRLTQTINVTTSGSVGIWGCFNWDGAVWGQ